MRSDADFCRRAADPGGAVIMFHDDPAIRPLLLDIHVGYLASLSMNDGYRSIARRFPAKQYWRAVSSVNRRRPLGRT